MTEKRKKIIGFIMSYNIAKLLPKMFEDLTKKAFYKLIVVDDGSSDNSIEVAKNLGLTVYSHQHLGYGGNVKYGLEKSVKLGADYVVEIHGDGQYEIADIEKKIKIMEKNGYSFLSGSRFIPLKQALIDGMPLHRFLANITLSFLGRFVLHYRFTDFNSGFRIYNKKIIQIISLNNLSNRYSFDTEIIIQMIKKGLKIGEVPVRCNYREPHTSVSFTQSLLLVIQNLYLLFTYRIK